MYRAMPNPTEAMPSVIMNGETLNTATPMPLVTPTSVPAAMPARQPTAIASHTLSGEAADDRRHGGGADHRSQCHDGPHRQIEAAGQQGEHLTERDDGQVDRLAHDVDQILRREEIVRDRGEHDQRHQQQEGQHAEPDEQTLRPDAHRTAAPAERRALLQLGRGWFMRLPARRSSSARSAR